MIKFDKKEFDRKCDHVVRDIKTKKLTSPAWIWIMTGAITGFISSCLKMSGKGSRNTILRRKHGKLSG